MSSRDHGELRELICKLSDGALTNEEADRLNALLKDDPIAQESYLDHLMIDGLLEREFDGAAAGFPSSMRGEKLDVECGSSDVPQPVACTAAPAELFPSLRQGIQTWVPLIRLKFSRWALAAGFLLIAGLATGWFFPFPRWREASPQPLALSNAGFESGTPLPVEIGATAVAPWYGDAAESVEQYLGVAPVEGRRMLRFVKSSAEPGNACEVYQFVDLRPLADITCRETLVEASAFFNSLQDDVNEHDYTFGITVFAFSEDPSEESKVWPMRWQQPLTFSGSQLPADAVPQSWQQVNTRLPLPAGTQFLVVQLSVIRTNPDADSHFPGQFADKVALNLMSSR